MNAIEVTGKYGDSYAALFREGWENQLGANTAELLKEVALGDRSAALRVLGMSGAAIECGCALPKYLCF
jgi:hypothetical protein